MAHLVTDAAGVGNAAGQSTRAVAEVVLVYFPVLVLISATTRKLRRRQERMFIKSADIALVLLFKYSLSEQLKAKNIRLTVQ